MKKYIINDKYVIDINVEYDIINSMNINSRDNMYCYSK